LSKVTWNNNKNNVCSTWCRYRYKRLDIRYMWFPVALLVFFIIFSIIRFKCFTKLLDIYYQNDIVKIRYSQNGKIIFMLFPSDYLYFCKTWTLNIFHVMFFLYTIICRVCQWKILTMIEWTIAFKFKCALKYYCFWFK